MKAKIPTCPWCKKTYTERVSRGFLLKNVFSFLPVRKYHCGSCLKDRFVFTW